MKPIRTSGQARRNGANAIPVPLRAWRISFFAPPSDNHFLADWSLTPWTGGFLHRSGVMVFLAAVLLIVASTFRGTAGNLTEPAAAVAVDDESNVLLSGYSLTMETLRSAIQYSSAGIPLWTNFDNPAIDPLFSPDESYVEPNFYVAANTVTIAYTSAGMPLRTNYWFGVTAVNSQARPVYLSAGNALLAYTSAAEPLWTNYSFGGNIVVDMHRDGALYLTRSNALLAYTGTGVPLWTNYGVGGHVAVDEENGNVYVAGISTVANQSSDYATAGYDSDGRLLWKNQFDGLANPRSIPGGIAVDSHNANVYVAGASLDTNGFSRYVLVAYSSKGVPLWTNNCIDVSATTNKSSQSAPPSGLPLTNSSATAPSTNLYYTTVSDTVEVEKNGDFYVAGLTYDAYGSYNYTLPSPVPLLFQKLNGRLVLSWTNAGYQLQSSPSFLGGFTNVPGATSPWTDTWNGDQQFFRLISQ